MTDYKKIAHELLLPEFERQLMEDPSLWPNIKGLFVLTVTQKKKPLMTWYLLLQGSDIKPFVSDDPEKVKEAQVGKVRVVKIQVEESDMFSFATGGMTGIKAYMTGKVKIRGDLMLAQRLEEVFEKVGGRKRAIDFIKKNPELIQILNSKAKL